MPRQAGPSQFRQSMVLFVCGFLLAFLCKATLAEPEVIPISKRDVLPVRSSEGIVILKNLLTHRRFAEEKYNATLYNYQEAFGEPYPNVARMMKPKSSNGPNRKRALESLTPQESSSFWSGPITISEQTFRIDFDTGSSDLWVPSVDCVNAACLSKHRYNVSASRTGGHLRSGYFSISYVDGSGVNGNVYQDMVVVAGARSSGQYFSAVRTMQTTLDDSPVDGILGMAFQSISSLRQPPVFQNIWNKNPKALGYNNYFSFYLSDNAVGSHLFLGGVDYSKIAGSLYSFPVTQKAYWQIGQAKVYANGQATAVSNQQAVIDTGTTLIYAPNATVSKIFAGVPGARYWQYGYWVAPCAAVPTIGFGFSAATPVFNVKPSDMNLGQTYRNSPDCVMSIVADSIIGQSLLMGDTFLKNVYSTFNFTSNAVQFGVLKAPPSNILPRTLRSKTPKGASV